LIWFRAILDEEINGLIALQDKYNIIIEEKLKLIRNFSKKNFNQNLFKEYLKELSNLPGAEILREDLKSEAEKRSNRNREIPNYFGELIIFVFSLGVIFLFLSIVKFSINNFILILSIILWFLLMIYPNSFKIVDLLFSKIANFLNNKKII
jgi:hypothetical protein